MTLSLAAVAPHPPILLPEIGAGREAAAQATLNAYTQIADALRADRPDRLLLISTHGIVTLHRFHLLTAPLMGDLEPFGAPQCRVEQPNDPTLAELVLAAARRDGQPLAPVEQWEPHDHSAIVPLTLLRDALDETPTTVVSVCFRSAHEHYEFGRCLAEAIASAPGRTVAIASGDGAHTLNAESPQGFHPQAAPFQRAFDDALHEWDTEAILGFEEALRREIDESVVSPTAVLAGILRGRPTRVELLAAEAPWGVAYTTALLRSYPRQISLPRIGAGR